MNRHGKTRAFLLFLATAIILVVIIGCDAVFPIYRPTTGGYLGADITPKKTWTCWGNLDNPSAAVDEDLSTIAKSRHSPAGAEITIDLKRLCLFQSIIIEHGQAQMGYCQSLAVLTSVDGKRFTKQYVAPGARRVTIILLPAPTVARYVRLRLLKPGLERWAIAEVFLQ